MKGITSIILAAGKGTRMKSKHPKVLHKVLGKSMIDHVIDVVDDSGIEKKVIVVGYDKEKVIAATKKRNVEIALQEETLGTAHAVMMAKDFIDNEDVLILCGDTPLLRQETIKDFIKFHRENKLDCSVMTANFDNSFGYGRIVRDDKNNVVKIVEEKDSNEDEKKIKEVNSGIYLLNGKLLKESFDEFKSNNSQSEYYLTDIIDIFNTKGYNVGGYSIIDNEEILGINSRIQLNMANDIMKNRILDFHMNSGVTIIDRNSTIIEKGVSIGIDTIIYSGTFISENTEIGEDCEVGPDTKIYNSKIKNLVTIKSSTIIDSIVDSGTSIGPYAYLRPNSSIGKNAKIGDFVEVKNSKIGNNSKVSHLSYIGDGQVGHNVNIGCGVVFVNYNGKEKNKTVVKDNSFVGCNVNLVAPVVVEEGAYVAAGSTITNNVEENSLSIARARQVNKKDWVKKSGLLKK